MINIRCYPGIRGLTDRIAIIIRGIDGKIVYLNKVGLLRKIKGDDDDVFVFKSLTTPYYPT
jgi:hypothetical protein